MDALQDCWICLDNDASNVRDFIAPCSCKAYVHRTCLDKFRTRSSTNYAMSHCSVCHSKFEYEDVESESESNCCEWRWHYYFCVELIKRCFFTALSVIALTLLVFCLDKSDGDFEILKYFPKNTPAFVAYLTVSSVLTVVLIGAFNMMCMWAEQNHMGYLSGNNVWIVSDTETLDSLLLLICVFAILMFFLTGLVVIFNIFGAAANVAADKLYQQSQRKKLVQIRKVKDLRPLPFKDV